MSTNNLKQLISKLNPICQTSLEAAAALCVTNSHHCVELEHWLLNLLSNNNEEYQEILLQCDIDSEQLQQELLKKLNNLRTGNDQATPLATPIIELISDAWKICSLDFDQLQITTLHLLLALQQNSYLNQLCLALSEQLHELLKRVPHINIEKLASKKLTPPLTTGSYHTSALEQYTIDLNQLAKQGKIDMAIGREQEILQMVDVLSRRRQNNPILVGEPGVGKTAIVEGLAILINNDQVPEHLKNVNLRTLDLGLLQAGAGMKGEFENRLKNIISEIQQSVQPIILFIDEAHTIVGTGAQAGQNDAANLIKPALARGELRTIAATTWAEYKKYFEKDAALTRRFQTINVKQPSQKKAKYMLRCLAQSLEKHHNVIILDSAIEAAVDLSTRYMPARQLPDKAISVLDTACAKVAISLSTQPLPIQKLQANIKHIQLSQQRLQDEPLNHQVASQKIDQLQQQQQDLEEQLNKLTTQWQQEKTIHKKIIQLRQQLLAQQTSAKDFNQLEQLQQELLSIQGDSPLSIAIVDKTSIAHVIAQWTGIPVGDMQKQQRQSLLSLQSQLQERVIGQQHGIETICHHVQVSHAKLSQPNQPLGVFLLLGPSGVGKTETAMALAEHQFASKENLTVINMSEFKEQHKVSMLMGSPPGYVGFGEGGILTEAVRRNPYSLVLLDEIEKAHSGVQDIFYQVFDKGILRDSEGRDIDFKNTIIVLTSNACSQEIEAYVNTQNGNLRTDALIKTIYPSLTKYFKPAFLGRVTIVPYLPLSEHTLIEIVNIQLSNIRQRILQHYQANFSYDEKVQQYILTHCQHINTGARQVQDIIKRQILPLISQQILLNLDKQTQLSQVKLTIKDKKVFCIVE